MALYTQTFMDHFMHPRNVGEIADADGVGEVGNAKCGDIMKMYLKIKDNKIEDVKFETFGCGSAIASSSIATEMIKGRTLDDALALTNQEVVDALGGLPAHKLHCSVLAEEAGWYNAKHRARPLAVPGLSVKIRFFWVRHSHRETQTSNAFPTCLRRPYLFSCKRKDRGEKSAWTRLVRAADTIQVSTNFIVVANTHRYLTTAMVRAACYGTPNL